MCCVTHGYRDSLTPPAELATLLATDERLRCQCYYGSQCRRQATAEDMLCEWCRVIEAGWPDGMKMGHHEWCRFYLGSAFASPPAGHDGITLA